MNTKLWGLLVILLLAFGGISWFLSTHNVVEPGHHDEDEAQSKPQEAPKLKKATREAGRVVTLHTTRGDIEFVLYEKDCPVTTKRIADLVAEGDYNGVKFPRVENWVIQTAAAKKDVPKMGIEVVQGLTHGKGAVGMARTSDPNSNTSVFYITLDPAPHLDLQYTQFGQVISGMDVAMKIKVGDEIKTATIRDAADADRKALGEALRIEAERRTQ